MLGLPKASERLKMFVEIGVQARSTVLRLEHEEDLQEFTDAIHKFATGTLRSIFSDEAFAHAMHTYHMSWRWARNGFPVLRLTHSLAAALLLTEPPPLDEGETLPTPWNTFTIMIPPGIVPVFDHLGEQHWADLLWVYQSRGYHTATGEKENFFRWLAQWGQIELWRDRKPTNLSDPVDEKLYSLFPDEPVPGAEDQVSLSTSLRLIRNLCHWLDSTHELDKPVAAHRRKKPRRFKGDRHTVYTVGQGVKLQPELRQMATEIALGRTRSAVSGWKLRLRHIVSGHWRMQPYGKERKLRKRIWIEAFWKGPEGEKAWRDVLATAEKKL